MTLRVKLTLWYVVLFSSLLLCTVLLYREWVYEPRRERQERREEHERIKKQEHEEEGENGEGNKTGGKKREEEEVEPEEMVEDLVENSLWIGIPALVLGLGGGWWLMRKAMMPVVALTKAAEQLNESNLDVQLARTGSGDELDRLTAVFNDMSLRLAASFRRIREFTLRASHELKTPLTVMRGSMETALGAQALTAEQRDRLHDEIEEIDRLAKIVDGLTLLTKADAGLIALKRDPVRLDVLLREIFSDGQVLARPSGVEVKLDVCEETTIQGDSNRLRQMLLNLMDNAVKYNQAGGSVTLALKVAGAQAEISISNTGPGLPEELLPRLFEPFFRGDASHTRDIDGCGLGLSIVRWIATAHGGYVTIASVPGTLTTVAVVLPLRATQ